MIGRGFGVHGVRIACDGIWAQLLCHLERVSPGHEELGVETT
jgi:hypothetical protein